MTLRALNPFAELQREIIEKVLTDRRLKRQAEQRLERLLKTYQALADDPRYRALYEELKCLMGEQLRRLVEQASHCRQCGAIANRIAVLQEVIAAPLEQVWFEREQERQQEPDEADETAASDE